MMTEQRGFMLTSKRGLIGQWCNGAGCRLDRYGQTETSRESEPEQKIFPSPSSRALVKSWHALPKPEPKTEISEAELRLIEPTRSRAREISRGSDSGLLIMKFVTWLGRGWAGKGWAGRNGVWPVGTGSGLSGRGLGRSGHGWAGRDCWDGRDEVGPVGTRLGSASCSRKASGGFRSPNSVPLKPYQPFNEAVQWSRPWPSHLLRMLPTSCHWIYLRPNVGSMHSITSTTWLKCRT